MEQKPVWASLTLWGAVLTIVGMVLKGLGVDVGDQIDELQKALPDLLQIAGIIAVIIGRLRPGAGAPLTRAQVFRRITPRN